MSVGKFYDWRERYGKTNRHNGWVQRYTSSFEVNNVNSVKDPKRLEKIYNAALGELTHPDIPTRIVAANAYIFRSVEMDYLPGPPASGYVSRLKANLALQAYDQYKDRNRWSGASQTPTVPSSGGIYFSLQQQALVNEIRHYGGPDADIALLNRPILKIRVNRILKLIDLTETNPEARNFASRVLQRAGLLSSESFVPLNVVQWYRFFAEDDCSIPRGVGLAIAASKIYDGLIVPTVRFSERSSFERGDNLVLFAPDNVPYPGLFAEEAFYFSTNTLIARYPVQFP